MVSQTIDFRDIWGRFVSQNQLAATKKKAGKKLENIAKKKFQEKKRFRSQILCQTIRSPMQNENQETFTLMPEDNNYK